MICLKWLKVCQIEIINVGKDVKKLEPSYFVG